MKDTLWLLTVRFSFPPFTISFGIGMFADLQDENWRVLADWELQDKGLNGEIEAVELNAVLSKLEIDVGLNEEIDLLEMNLALLVESM